MAKKPKIKVSEMAGFWIADIVHIPNSIDKDRSEALKMLAAKLRAMADEAEAMAQEQS
jgi:hypothetical protein